MREGVGIQIAGSRRPIGQNERLSYDYIGALMEVEGAAGVGGIDDRNRPAGLHGDDGIQLPASAQRVRQCFKSGHDVGEGGGPAVPRIKRRRPFFGGDIIGVLWKRCAGEVEIDAIGSAIERLGKRVSGKAGESVEILKARGSL